MVRIKHPNDLTYYYKGSRNNEHLVKIKFDNGQVQYYKGNKGKEHLIRTEHPNKTIVYFNGPKGYEYSSVPIPPLILILDDIEAVENARSQFVLSTLLISPFSKL